MNLSDKMRLASALFGKEKNTGTRSSIITAQAVSDSADGMVTVIIGDEEEGVTIDDVTITIPSIGGISAGDEVLIAIVNGKPQAIGISGWGDDVDDSITDLDKSVSGLEGDVSDLDKSVSDLDKSVSGLEGDVSGLKDDVSNLDGAVSDLTSDVINNVYIQMQSCFARAGKVGSSSSGTISASSDSFEKLTLSSSYSRIGSSSYFKISSGDVVIQKAGIYTVDASVYFSSLNDYYRGCYVYVNGEEACGSYLKTASSPSVHGFEYEFSKGDTVSLYARGNSSTSLTYSLSNVMTYLHLVFFAES